MAVERSIFKIRHHVCQTCGGTRSGLAWDYDTFTCCEKPMTETANAVNRSALVIGDDIDWTIRHGPCNEDGTPRRFRSRGEWKQACIDSGWTPKGDTPITRAERNRWY